MTRPEEGRSYADMTHGPIPYILIAGIIVIGGAIIYLILAPGAPPPGNSTTSSSSGTSFYSAGGPAPLTPTPGSGNVAPGPSGIAPQQPGSEAAG